MCTSYLLCDNQIGYDDNNKPFEKHTFEALRYSSDVIHNTFEITYDELSTRGCMLDSELVI